MWQWLKSRFGKPAPAVTAPPDLWKPKERLIFKYWDGEKERLVDPMPLWRKVKDVMQEVEADLVLARSPMKGSLRGFELASKRLRKAFDLKPHEEGGLTELECVELYQWFTAWVGVEKKNTPSPSTTSSETSAPTPDSSGSANGATPPTANGSAGGSTDADSSTPTPSPSPSE